MNKCVPVQLNGLEACPLNKPQVASLDFVVNRFIKLVNTSDIEMFKLVRSFSVLLFLVFSCSRVHRRVENRLKETTVWADLY